MCFHVPLELAGLGAGVVTKMAFVWPLSCVAAPVDNQVALELEDLATELTRFRFTRGLVLGVRRAGGIVAALRRGRLRGVS